MLQEIGYGFSFDGIHCDDMNCELANNTAVMHRIVDSVKVSSETADGYDGAYYAGITAQSVSITLELLIEDVDDGVIMRIGNWLKPGKSGKLIFDHAPYKYYNARVTKGATPPVYMGFDRANQMWTRSGKISVDLTLFIPRAYMLEEVKTGYPISGWSGMNTLNAVSGIMTQDDMPSLSGTTSILVPNFGNADANPEIWMKGSFANGTTVTNETTGQSFTLKTETSTTKVYAVNSMNGLTYEFAANTVAPTTETQRETVYATDHELKDQYRSGNFITLKPCYPFERNISITFTDNIGVVTGHAVRDREIGMYVAADNSFYEITDVDVDDNTITIDGELDGEYAVNLLTLNKLTITAGTGDTVNNVSVFVRDTFY